MKLASIFNIAIFSLSMLGLATAGPYRVEGKGHDHNHGYKTIVLDVACDGATYAPAGLANVAQPGEEPDMQEVRGSTFIVNGVILPGGSIPDGDGFDLETARENSLGTWVCRGTYNFSLAEILEGATPHVATTQHYLFGNDGSLVPNDTLVSEGQEGGVPSQRTVTGGTGKYRGVAGEVEQEFLGTNSSGFENFRFTFKIKR